MSTSPNGLASTTDSPDSAPVSSRPDEDTIVRPSRVHMQMSIAAGAEFREVDVRNQQVSTLSGRMLADMTRSGPLTVGIRLLNVDRMVRSGRSGS